MVEIVKIIVLEKLKKCTKLFRKAAYYRHGFKGELDKSALCQPAINTHFKQVSAVLACHKHTF